LAIGSSTAAARAKRRTGAAGQLQLAGDCLEPVAVGEQVMDGRDEQLTTKEAVVDRYLAEYEDNKIDRATVARRVEKISEQIRPLRHLRDELVFLLDDDTQLPTPPT
jgi:hypothetical protein